MVADKAAFEWFFMCVIVIDSLFLTRVIEQENWFATSDRARGQCLCWTGCFFLFRLYVTIDLNSANEDLSDGYDSTISNGRWDHLPATHTCRPNTSTCLLCMHRSCRTMIPYPFKHNRNRMHIRILFRSSYVYDIFFGCFHDVIPNHQPPSHQYNSLYPFHLCWLFFYVHLLAGDLTYSFHSYT